MKCSCGKDAHPCYGTKCEDCYLDGIPYLPFRHESYRTLKVQTFGLGGFLRPGLAVDRHWNRPKDSISN